MIDNRFLYRVFPKLIKYLSFVDDAVGEKENTTYYTYTHTIGNISTNLFECQKIIKIRDVNTVINALC